MEMDTLSQTLMIDQPIHQPQISISDMALTFSDLDPADAWGKGLIQSAILYVEERSNILC